MRIAWVSPWNAYSAIAAFGLIVVNELIALGHHVDVVRSETAADLERPAIASRAKVKHPSAMTSQAFAQDYDAVVVNMGNHFPYHGGAIPLLLDNPASVMILHDAWMGHFLGGWKASADTEKFRVEAWQSTFEEDPSGLTALCSLANCAVVHSGHYRQAVERAVAGCVERIPLAYRSPPTPEWNAAPDGTLSIITIGHANPNKQIAEVIRALGASARLRDRARYRIVGLAADEERERLTAIASKSGFGGLSFTGHLPDEELSRLTSEADVICCLRNPLTEGGSASIIVAMQSGRPVIVSDHGCYAEIPDGLVLKCPPGFEAAHVIRHLEWVLDEPERANAMAIEACAYAYRVHHPAVYAAALLNVIDEAISITPVVLAEREIGRILSAMGVQPDDPFVRRVHDAMSFFDSER